MTEPVNPFQDTIDWLRSPAGEYWSETRMYLARCGIDGNTLIDYGYKGGPIYLGGVLSVKEDWE